jgi:hypothetical protein
VSPSPDSSTKLKKNGHYFRSKDDAILQILDFFKTQFLEQNDKKIRTYVLYMDTVYILEFFCKG